MKLHPFYECAEKARKLIEEKNADVYQQFLCAKCGTKQTMETPNVFHKRGLCEECGGETNMEVDGCNYMVHFFNK